MKKRLLSLAVALVLCLGLAVPAFAAGETTVTDSGGVEYTLSKPVVRTETWNLLDDWGENPTPITVYVVPEGTVITPKLAGSISDEAGRALSQDNGTDYSIYYHLWDWSGQLGEISIDEEGYKFSTSEHADEYYFSEEDNYATILAPPGIYRIYSRLIWTIPPVSSGSGGVGGNGAGNGRKYFDIYFKIETDEPTEPQQPTAAADTLSVLLDGNEVSFYVYALTDANGGVTNYVKLRDVAAVLNGTKAQFEVGWNGSINLETGKPYTPNGSEMIKNFDGDQPYKKGASPVNVNGAPAELEAITLTDANGGAYNYFKLRDLGKALGFNVSWINGGVVIASDEPYSDAQ